MDNNQVLIPPPLNKERVERVLARIAVIHEEIRRQGIDLSRLPDPVEILRQTRDGTPPE